jgi:CheY-like chemotaxis protein
MDKSVLIVEDEVRTRTEFAKVLQEDGWRVQEAENGLRALDILRSNSTPSLMVLDLRMPNMGGLELLKTAKKEGIHLPLVVVLSAYLNSAKMREYLDLGVAGLLPKPVHPASVRYFLNALYTNDEAALLRLPVIGGDGTMEVDIVEDNQQRSYSYCRQRDRGRDEFEGLQVMRQSEALLSEEVKRREKALVEYFKKTATAPTAFHIDEPLLVVGRRWNSWYPSFFDVPGGAYIVLGVPDDKGQASGVIIDPGFRALSILYSLGISVANVSNCVITHNHPDHIGGVFEYVAARHALGLETAIFCNPAASEMLKGCAGSKLSIKELSDMTFDIIGPYRTVGGNKWRLTATPLPTSHSNVGSVDSTRGIVLSSDLADESGTFHPNATAVLLGDTEYNSSNLHPNRDLFDRIRRALARPDIKVAVVHIGCSQLKEETGKHLYLPGLINLLRDLDDDRRRNVSKPESNKLLILVSEWGLEHASQQQLASIVPKISSEELINAFSEDNLVLKTIKVIQSSWGFDTLNLLPADIGLRVGLETGRIYFENGDYARPEDVSVRPDAAGLCYYKQNSNP